MKNFSPLLFGGDINVYSVARAFHEAYGVKSICYGKFASGPAYASSIIDYSACANIEEPAVFLSKVQEAAAKHADKTLILLGCGDSYVQLAADARAHLPDNVVSSYVSGEQIAALCDKEQFYALCDEYGLAHPETFIHRREMGSDFTLPFAAPYVCKPSNGVSYWAHPFPGNEKVFICRSRKALEEVLARVYASGYPDSMIIQDFIPGDDSHMRVLTNYSCKDASVSLMCLGHVLLEEHTPHGIGNHAVILTGKLDEAARALCADIQRFLEGIQFRGFSNFDIKYDSRDGKFKVFEINCRQGRSNYYVTGAGYNIAKWLVSDLIEDKPLPLTLAERESLWQVVPRRICFSYIAKEHHAAIKAQLQAGSSCNPLFYAPDKGLSRQLRLYKNQLSHFKKYRRYGTKKT